jgi:membrane-bound serine protease (ClpP class)
MKRLRLFFGISMLLGFAGLGAGAFAAPGGPSAGGGGIVVIPISGTVDDGMAHIVERGIAEAEATHARGIVLDVNTPGGLVSSAFDIRDALLGAKVPTLAYISERAYSAGALISLSCKTIVMAPGSSIGAAEPIPNDPKHVSALRAEFASTAKREGRSPVVAAAMVDKSVDLPAFKKDGAILSLTSDEAVRAKVADAISPTLAGALADAHLPSGPLHYAAYSFAENLARFATSPDVSGILLSIGVLGLLIEMQTLHGIAGAIGVTALALFFGSHVYVGFSNLFVIALAIAGVLGILFELHVVPGHGIAGGFGVIALAAAIVLSFGIGIFFGAVQSISIAIVLTVALFAIFTRYVPESAFFDKIVFTGTQGADYVSSRDFRDLVGHAGFATSFLRPAGVASIDGRRVDVLTAGDFVPAGSPIIVTRVEGARIFVDLVDGKQK